MTFTYLEQEMRNIGKNGILRILILTELEHIGLDRYTNMKEISHTKKFAFI